MVSMDTFRADRLGCFGYGRPTTPTLDRLASEGALFTRAFASDIPTQPSHTCVFTGRLGISSDIVSHYFGPARLAQETPWLPMMLRDAGHATGAVDHLFVMKDWFIRGYQDYMTPPGRSRSCAAVVNEMAFPWLTEHAGDDFFMFLHYWDAHIPYVPPRRFRDRFAARSLRRRDPLVQYRIQGRPSYPLFKRNLYDHLEDIPNLGYIADLYDAEVAYLDSELGALTRHLERLGILDDVMLVLFADHGENMTEHDAWFDHSGLYDAVTHVPVIVRHPPSVPRARVDAMVQLVDLFPTICESAGLSTPDGVDGRSLHPLMTGGAEAQYQTLFLSEATWQAKRAVRTERWKYIHCYDPGIYERRDPELYDLEADPDEQLNIARFHPDVVEALELRLQTFLADKLDGRPDPIDEVIRVGLPAVERLNGVIAEDLASAAKTA